MTRILFVEISRNTKTGPIPVTMTDANTCNSACPFNTKNIGGCYAAYGRSWIHWNRLSTGKTGIEWNDFLNNIRKLPKNQLWRHNQAGDLPGIDGKINVKELAALVKANRGRKGFTYTHKNVFKNKTNRKAIKNANDNGFTINLSANNLSHADKLIELNIGPVVAVVPSDLGRQSAKDGTWLETEAEYKARIGRVVTPAGNAVVVCPATYQDDMTCARCGICATSRKAIVAFPAHGAARNKVNSIVINRVKSIS